MKKRRFDREVPPALPHAGDVDRWQKVADIWKPITDEMVELLPRGIAAANDRTLDLAARTRIVAGIQELTEALRASGNAAISGSSVDPADAAPFAIAAAEAFEKKLRKFKKLIDGVAKHRAR